MSGAEEKQTCLVRAGQRREVGVRVERRSECHIAPLIRHQEQRRIERR